MPTARSSARSTTAAPIPWSPSPRRASGAASTRRSSCASSASTSAAAGAASRRSPRPAVAIPVGCARRSRPASERSRQRSHEGDGARLRLGPDGCGGLRPHGADRPPALRGRARWERRRARGAREPRRRAGAGAGGRRTAVDAPGRAGRAGAGDRALLRGPSRRPRRPGAPLRRALHDRPGAADALGLLRGRARRRAPAVRLSRVVERRARVISPPEPPPRQVSRQRILVRRAAAILGLLLAGLLAFGLVKVAMRGGSQPPAPTVTAALPPPKPLRVLFPEGFTRVDMAKRVQAVVRIAERKRHVRPRLSERTYLAATRARRIPGFGPRKRPLEGFLFPATYDLLRRTTSAQLVRSQLEAFQQNWRKVGLASARKKNLTPYDVLTIASMVEKEAVAPADRPKVARVIYNRLKLGMPLGIAATIRYALHIPGTQSRTRCRRGCRTLRSRCAGSTGPTSRSTSRPSGSSRPCAGWTRSDSPARTSQRRTRRPSRGSSAASCPR